MLTNEEIFEEYLLCSEDPKYAIEKYLKTFDKTQEGFVPFKLFKKQREIIDNYEKYRFNLITKPRQAGISTTTQAYAAMKCVFADKNNPETIIVIANKLTLAKKFAKGIKDFVAQMPRWAWGPEYYGTKEKEKVTIFEKDSQIEIELINGSKIIAVATSTDALRGYTPTFLIFDEAAFIDKGAELYGAAITSLGCLTKESLILTENGLVELNELVTEKDNIGFTDLITPHKVCNMYGNIVDATQTFVSEYGKTFRFKTKLGIELEGSWKHPILVKRGCDDIWVKMNDLVVGDEPIIQYNQNYFGGDSSFKFEYSKRSDNINLPIKLEDNLNFTYLLGLFLSKGNFTTNGVTITNIDENISDFLLKDEANLGNEFKKSGDKYLTFNSNELIEWFTLFGFKKCNARDKEIPLNILKMPKMVIKAFLQGLFDSGSVTTQKHIKYSATSKKLVKTLQTLLLNFGIVSSIKYSNGKNVCGVYDLKIHSEDAIKFYDEIGFRLEMKQNGRDFLLNKMVNSVFTSVIENKSIFIDEIVLVEEFEDYTYDLHVPDSNSFISNGVISHNTGGKSILISTPNGYDALYYKTYEQSINGDNDYNIIEMKWYQDPRYNKDLRWLNKEGVSFSEVEFTHESYEASLRENLKPTSKWYEDMCKGMNNDKRRISQELDVSFLGSGGNVIDDEYIMMQENLNVCDPKFIDKKYFDGQYGLIWVWDEPIEKHEYIMACLPIGEKVLTENGLVNIEDVKFSDKLIGENGEYVNIINTQIYPVVNEDVYEVKMSNTFRTTKFTKEHPILISKPNLDLNHEKNDFNYTKMESVEIGDWCKVPNIYKKTIEGVFDGKWVSNPDFDSDNPLEVLDFWWFIGVWLGNGQLDDVKNSHTMSLSFNKTDTDKMDKCFLLINKIFNVKPSVVEEGPLVNLVFDSKFLYYFILENFGENKDNKKIAEWVKFTPKEYKEELLRGCLGSSLLINVDKDSPKISFVSVNLTLLESIQDIIFSLGVISSINKLKGDKRKEIYNLKLSNYSSLELIKLLYDDLNTFSFVDDVTLNKGSVKSCHFDDDKDYIYFRVNDITRSEYTGNVYNFECETHTFMCHHITTHNCDVARGDGSDSSTFQIIDFTTMEQVCEYQGKIQPDLFAEIIDDYGKRYNAYVVVDNIGVGGTTAMRLEEMKYPNLHYDESKSRLFNTNTNPIDDKNKVPGFNVNGVRLNLVSLLEEKVRTNTVKIRSKRLINEMRTFIYKNARPDHMEGYHDDCLMALGMGLWVLEHSFKKLRKVSEMTKSMLSGWIMPNNNIDSVVNSGFVPKDSKNKKSLPKPKFSAVVAKNMQDPNGDYSWLFSGFK